MREITITEALAEIPTTMNRVKEKMVGMVPYLIRPKDSIDPMKDDGGVEAFIEKERQSISDLLTKIVHIRTAVAQINLVTQLEVEGRKMSVAEWLVWKREVAPHLKTMYDAMLKAVREARSPRALMEAVSRQADKYADIRRLGGRGQQEEPDPSKLIQIIVHFKERALLDEMDNLTKTLGGLDGKLSLLNASIKIKVED